MRPLGPALVGAALALVSAVPTAAGEAVLNGFRMHYEDRGRGEAVIFLHGFTLELDQPHILLAGEEAARRVRGARKILYAGAGHMLNMEDPHQFNRDLEAFLSAHPGR